MITAKIVRKPKYDKIDGGKWKYVTTTVAVFEFVGIFVKNCAIFHKDKKLAYVERNRLYILSDYAWDGMTCYPDSDENIFDSLLHDILYQTALISRKNADVILKNMSAKHDPFYIIIYLGVNLCGWMFYGKDRNVRIENT